MVYNVLETEETFKSQHLKTCASTGRPLILFFKANWHPPCATMNTVVQTLATDTPEVDFLAIEAEDFPDISANYPITSVPTFICVKGETGEVVDVVEGASAPLVVKMVNKHKATTTATTTTTRNTSETQEIQTKLTQLTKAHKLMVFMYGSPGAKGSDDQENDNDNELVKILRAHNLKFGYFDVNTDKLVQTHMLKLFPVTQNPNIDFPVLFADGKIVGGFNEVRDKIDVLKKLSPASEGEEGVDALNARIKKLLHSHHILLFMKGSPGNEKCGFSRQMVALLNENGFKDFSTFDILLDNEIRQGLKEYSNWKTYPQLYVNGELIGGLDVCKELAAEGELSELANTPPIENPLHKKLKELVNKEKVMLFMKGSPGDEKCGFSRQMVALLKENGFSEFGHFDILLDDEVRQGLKEYSNWKTYPQLYVNGELIGGLDVCKELAADGELNELV